MNPSVAGRFGRRSIFCRPPPSTRHRVFLADDSGSAICGCATCLEALLMRDTMLTNLKKE